MQCALAGAFLARQHGDTLILCLQFRKTRRRSAGMLDESGFNLLHSHSPFDMLLPKGLLHAAACSGHQLPNSLVRRASLPHACCSCPTRTQAKHKTSCCACAVLPSPSLAVPSRPRMCHGYREHRTRMGSRQRKAILRTGRALVCAHSSPSSPPSLPTQCPFLPCLPSWPKFAICCKVLVAAAWRASQA